MPRPNLDCAKFVVYQRESSKDEIVAHIVKEDGLNDLDKYMTEAGYSACPEIRGSSFKAAPRENFIIRLVGDIRIDTFGDKSYHKDRMELVYLRNRSNRKDIFVRGVYHGRFQAEYGGKVLLHRTTLQAGKMNRGSGNYYTPNNLESILGNVVASSKLVLPKDRDDPAPRDIQVSFEAGHLVKDIVLRTISKDIPKNFVVPLAKHILELTEFEVLNMTLLPHPRDFNEQRYAILERWKLSKGKDATFSGLIEAFKTVKLKTAATSLNRNLLTDQYMKKTGKALPGDLKPFADLLGINIDDVKRKFDDEMTEHKYQVLRRWREDNHHRIRRRGNHTRLLRALRYSGMEDVAQRHTAISSVNARDVEILRIITKDLSRDSIIELAMGLGLSSEQVDAIIHDNGQDFNKRIFFLNALVKWRENSKESEATFENLISVMTSHRLETSAAILNELLLSDKRLRALAPQISDSLIHDLADELRLDTTTMVIPRGGAEGHLGYRLLLRWKETRGKYASHTELQRALERAGLDNIAKDVDQLESVNITKGAVCDFCLRYVSSWVHTSRAHEWPSLVQNIPTSLVSGLDQRTVKQISQTIRDPQEQMTAALIICRDRKIIPTATAMCKRLIAAGFEQTASTLHDISQSQYYCSTLRLDDAEEGD